MWEGLSIPACQPIRPPSGNNVWLPSVSTYFEMLQRLFRREPAGRKPAVEVAERPRRQRLLTLLAAEVAVDRGKQAEVDVHRLERAGVGAAGDVVQQRAHRGRDWRRARRLSAQFCGGEASGQQADGGAFDIAFAAGD